MYTPILKTSNLCALSFDKYDLIHDVFDRLDDIDDYGGAHDALSEAIDESLTYTADQWKLLEAYCTPSNADLDAAITLLYYDCTDYIDWEEVEEE